ncbi:mannitol 1-phosphate dehydrogenase [Ampelomyces quisqualis]|uniref:Mannitol 1-phosphate dehydrogenase n=1 Tax=Ampelomyces quisqualis TaxID=50730 RepID=A0A6A5QZQ6_AMPQU|nr:mannitol 1-phosphate dehydrogenase [Ampelomyces quisqualis]
MSKYLPTPFKNHPSLPIAIIGGGLCGLPLAIGLVKHNINVHIYESAPAFSEIGAGVAFGVNAISALQLIDPRLLEGYKLHATFNEDRERDATFYSMRWGVDGENGEKKGDRGWDLSDKWFSDKTRSLGVRTRSCIHRAKLLEQLIALLPPGTTTFNKSFSHAIDLSDNTIQLFFADGSSALCSALMGCDGIKSKVRARVCPDVKPTYAREIAYRAVVPRANAIAALGADAVLNGSLWCGYGAYIISYPIAHGASINMVAIRFDADATSWPENRESTLPVPNGEIQEKFHAWFSPLVDLFVQHRLPSKWALHVLAHSSPYFNGKICILGDAAHATVPHLGAGAGMAMEDAYILSELIANVGDITHIEKAFRAYDMIRRPRTQECVRRSMEASVGYGFRGKEGEDVKGDLERSFRWLWGVDLVGELEIARRVLETGIEGCLMGGEKQMVGE